MTHKGKWAGLRAEEIAGLMGCSETAAKRKLRKLAQTKELTLADIGNLIYEYRGTPKTVDDAIGSMLGIEWAYERVSAGGWDSYHHRRSDPSES